MSKIALTGATGFVGRSVLPALLQAGHEVSILVRRPRLGQFPPQVNVFEGDLNNHAALARLVEGATCVVHLAGAISAVTTQQFFDANLEGVKAILAAAQHAKIARFVQVSSLAAREPKLSPYAASKRAGEDYLLENSSSISTVILRPSAIYGPGDKATLPLLAALQQKTAFIPGDAKARFSLLHVRDFAQVILDAITSSVTGIFEVDDMAGGHDWAELGQVNAQISGRPEKIRYIPHGLLYIVALMAEGLSIVSRKPGMVTRAKLRELYHSDWVVQGKNWSRPNPIGLADGLGETLSWYRSQGWLAPLESK